MSEIRQRVTVAVGGAVVLVVGTVVIAAILLWPLSLWWVFGESLALSIALTVIWMAAVV